MNGILKRHQIIQNSKEYTYVKERNESFSVLLSSKLMDLIHIM